MAINKIKLLEQRIEEHGSAFQQIKNGLEEVLPSVRVQASVALETAEREIERLVVGMCSRPGASEPSGLGDCIALAHRQQAILDNLDAAEKILKHRLEERQEKINHLRKLLSRQNYINRFNEIASAGIPVTDQQCFALAALAVDAIGAKEAHVMCETLNDHFERNQRLNLHERFDFRMRRHGLDNELAKLK